MEKKRLEILAPAGSFESMKAAVHAGADAVYMGGSRFGARAYAENPEEDLLLEAIDYAHLYGVKLYLTVNTLLKERELKELYEYLNPYYAHGLDAVIVQDMGVLKAIREWFPDLHIHASTQMTLCGAGGMEILKEAGVQRVVLARELSLGEIAKIHKETGMEIECFVHGALCYCYSGQCLFSSILGGRSGNRGRCAQPCRLSYDVLEHGNVLSQKGENALLSPKDICAIELLPQIAEAGVYSLKIEGRMKRPEYTAGVVRIYRKYVDRYLQYGSQDYRVSEEDKKELLLLFNRDGFSRGYYEQHNGRNMMALWNRQATEQEKKDYEKLITFLKKEYVDTQKKCPISGCLYAGANQPMSLTLWSLSEGMREQEITVTVEGDCPQPAQNRPMEPAQIEKQLRKTGNTPFEWKYLQIETDGALFIPVQALNSLRREGLFKLQEEIKSVCRRNPSGCKALQPESELSPNMDSGPEKRQRGLHISVENKEQLSAVLKQAEQLKLHPDSPLTTVYLDAESLEEELPSLLEQIHQEGLRAYVTLPSIFRMETEARYEGKRGFWENLDAEGYVLKNLEEYEFLRKISWKKDRILDHNLYTFNRKSREMWRELGVIMQTNPLELNAKELREISDWDSIQVIYGRYPMMTTAGCLHKTLKQCRKAPGQWMLRDRYQKEFPVKNYCRDCYNVIYNSQPLYLLDQMDSFASWKAGAYRMMFTTETAAEVQSVLKGWMTKERPQREFTRGHFKRGVE